MKVKLTRATFIAGEYVEPPRPGKDGKPPKDDDGVITVSETDGRNLIAAGKAMPVSEAAKAAANNRAATGAGASTRG